MDFRSIHNLAAVVINHIWTIFSAPRLKLDLSNCNTQGSCDKLPVYSHQLLLFHEVPSSLWVGAGMNNLVTLQRTSGSWLTSKETVKSLGSSRNTQTGKGLGLTLITYPWASHISLLGVLQKYKMQSHSEEWRKCSWGQKLWWRRNQTPFHLC